MEIPDEIQAAPQQQEQQLDAAGDGDALDEQLTDSSRIWSAGVLLELAHIWRRVELAHPTLGRVAKAQLVYDEFSDKVDRGGNANDGNDSGTVAKRSRKAVEDKLYTMKQMYRFIIEMNRDFMRQRNARSGMRSWFDLSKQERRAVRSLHGIRIPNISHEVFQVLDSVLYTDSAPVRPRKKAKERKPLEAIEYNPLPPLPPPRSLDTNDGDDDDDDDDDDAVGEGISQQEFVLDGKRNWSADATMQLARIWGDIQCAYPSLRGTLLGDHVYTMFKAKAGGSLSRSQKAVEEKMQSMKEMYRFIKSYEDARGGVIASDGNTGGLETKSSWFELTKAERRQLRKANKIRVTNLSREQFDQVDAIMSVRAEAEAVFLEITGQQPSPAAPVTSVVQPQQQTQRATNGSNASNNSANQSSGVLDAMQRVIAQELRAGNSVEPQPGGSQVSPTAAMRAQKRPRADGPVSAPLTAQVPAQAASRAGAVGIDYAAAEYLLEKIRYLHEQDRAERRRQHEEHMEAIRELAALLKNHQQQQQTSAVVRETAAVADGV